MSPMEGSKENEEVDNDDEDCNVKIDFEVLSDEQLITHGRRPT